METLYCAIYARDKQRPESIADQIYKCRRFAEQHGWVIAEEHIYFDEAVSGTSMEREGLKRLMIAATNPSPPFQCILIDDSSRLSRNLADTLNLYTELEFRGIRLVYVSQGLDSAGPDAELLLGVHGLIDSNYWRGLAQKTHRGLHGLARRGLFTGGALFRLFASQTG